MPKRVKNAAGTAGGGMRFFDPDEIAAALDLAAGDDEAVRAELAEAFRASLHQSCAALLDAGEAGQAELLHRLRGLAASFGASSVQRLVDEITTAGVAASAGALRQILRETAG